MEPSLTFLFADTETPKGVMPFFKENWLALLPIVLGFAAVYVLLPKARRSKPIWGALAAAVALVFGAAVLVRSDAALVEAVLFYSFAGIAIVGGVMMIAQSNPVHAALSFALVVLSTCGLFLLQAAPFLMAATIIIYAGAIVVTFLFVIMLAQQEGISDADQRSREPFLASLAGCILLVSLVCILQRTYDASGLDDVTRDLQQLADAKSRDDVKRVLGDPKPLLPGQFSRPLVEKLKKRFTKDSDLYMQSGNLQGLWIDINNVKKEDIVDKIRGTANTLLKEIQWHRQSQGSVALAHTPGKDKTPGHFEPGKLPAGNVAAMGRTLFTDYLVAVELAAALLLVATIGAIAIAGRRSEVLR
jgi:NADH-quinone oxidoreductase subunit J